MKGEPNRQVRCLQAFFCGNKGLSANRTGWLFVRRQRIRLAGHRPNCLGSVRPNVRDRKHNRKRRSEPGIAAFPPARSSSARAPPGDLRGPERLPRVWQGHANPAVNRNRSKTRRHRGLLLYQRILDGQTAPSLLASRGFIPSLFQTTVAAVLYRAAHLTRRGRLRPIHGTRHDTY